MAFTKTRVTGNVGVSTFSKVSGGNAAAAANAVGAESRSDGDMLGVKGGFGRGHTDQDITYIELRDSAGAAAYVYPATGGASIVVSTTKP